ncbi:hypothetical protein [Neptuniibacter sp.]|uniref:hypothetical protein n=1 Tax=Neptuniibacter sp. TaxID=1962643 RepID=UPI0026186311|nr:hypothetical protein [Neptuniibacter sp.]MCP4597579.1 hypothetical protein [Neptuniibacter sp.]
MKSDEYKQVCSLTNVLPRNILEETEVILSKANMPESGIVKNALCNGVIEFPKQYQGDFKSSYHRVTCSAEEAERIADYLFEKEAESVPVSGITTYETSRLVNLVNIWHELAEYVQR